MKTRHQQWARLGLGWKAPKPPPIKIRDLPGYEALSSKVDLFAPIRGPWPPELDHAADLFTLRHFGVGRKDVPAHDLSDDDWNRSDVQAEALDILLQLGVDASDGKGAALRGLRLIFSQIEAAAAGEAGRLPDRVVVEAERFGMNLAAEVEAHMARKRAGQRR